MDKEREKSLVGWINAEEELYFPYAHCLDEANVPTIYKTRKSIYFNNQVYSEKSKYKVSPRKVRITIEEL